MPIDRRCRLRAAVAIHAFEIEGGHPVLAEGAFERRAAIHRFGCVISHIFNGSPYYLSGPWGNRCATLGQETCVTQGPNSRGASDWTVTMKNLCS
jgi:hypothetical protein